VSRRGTIFHEAIITPWLENALLEGQESNLSPVSPGGREHSSRRSLVLISLVSLLLQFPRSYLYLIVGPIYGLQGVNAVFAAFQYVYWLQLGIDALLFYAAYRIGRGIAFERSYILLGAVVLSGAIIGEIPGLFAVGGTTATAPVSFSLAGDPTTYAAWLVSAFELAAIPFAGVALAYFTRNSTKGLSEGVSSGSKAPNPSYLTWGFVIVTLASVASGVTSALRLGVSPSSDQLAFLRTIFSANSPYSPYAFDLFYPVFFALVFFLLGRKLDPNRGLWSFGIAVFLAGAIGHVVGIVLNFYLTSPTPAFPSYLVSIGFLEGAGVQGLLVLALGFAAASTGFVRSAFPGAIQSTPGRAGSGRNLTAQRAPKPAFAGPNPGRGKESELRMNSA
jgi:hypothetical protein